MNIGTTSNFPFSLESHSSNFQLTNGVLECSNLKMVSLKYTRSLHENSRVTF